MKELIDKISIKRSELFDAYTELGREYLNQLSLIVRNFPEINQLVFHNLSISAKRKDLVFKKINNNAVFFKYNNEIDELKSEEIQSLLISENIKEQRFLQFAREVYNFTNSTQEKVRDQDILFTQIFNGGFYTSNENGLLVVKKQGQKI
jgi:hypothetical protein